MSSPSSKYASLTTWTADDNQPWQVSLQTRFLFSLSGCKAFNNKLIGVLEYRIGDQEFYPSLTIIGDPETESEFERRLPILQLIKLDGKEHQVENRNLELFQNFKPTNDKTLLEYMKQFSQDTKFYLLAISILNADKCIVGEVNNQSILE